MKIESFKIEMRPFMSYGQDMYEISVRVNGKIASVSSVVTNQLPHEAEIEVLTRMGNDLIRGLRDKERHGGCCDCCEKKQKCQKY